MKKDKKVLAIVGVLSTALTMLVACGGPSTSNSSTDSTPNVDYVVPTNGFDTSKDVEITFYHTMGQSLQQILDIFLEDFYELYPNITVKHTAIGSYDDVRDQMTTQLSTGVSDCDLAYCYPDHIALYNKSKKVISLNGLIDDPTYGYTQAQKDDFVDAYYEEGNCFGDGKLYSLPFSKSSEVLYYDKTFFDANKLTPPKTWDEMEAVCAKIKEIDSKSWPLGYDSSSNWFITMTEQLGSKYTSAEEGNHFLFNNDENKAFVKRFKGWFDKGYVTTKGLYGSYTSGLFTNVGDQRCYMCIGSSAGASYQTAKDANTGNFAFETGIVPIPQVDGTNKGAVISQGPNICLFNSGDDQKIMASWLLLKFLTTDKLFQAQFSMTSGYTPVIESVADEPIYKSFLESADGGNNIAALSTSITVSQKNNYFTSPAFVGSSKAREEVGVLLDAVFSYVPTGATEEEKNAKLDEYIDNAFASSIFACEQASK